MRKLEHWDALETVYRISPMLRVVELRDL